MRISSIQFKAAFLLFVFSLSTIVGFACSVGLNTTLNADHHKEPTGHQHKSHEHGKSHVHAASADHHQTPVSPHQKPSDHHQEEANHHKQVSNPQENPEDNCCKDEVAKFEKGEKRAPQFFNYNLEPLFVTLGFITTFNRDVLESDLHLPSNKYFVRNHHPPIADTRIAIQSFLI
ncbi:MAG: hypothetical protein WBJ10_10140 [Daejeonella sp.]|uniref:HYC_CC_PP family protein n=1 Tax=Daejeonella sp. TaxID=2805397 RepID=UPI003C76047D